MPGNLIRCDSRNSYSGLYGLEPRQCYPRSAMKIRLTFYSCIPWFALLFSVALPGSANARAADDVINSRTAEIEGVGLHYLTAGHGPAVILLHGYTQTSRMWR